MRRYCFFLKLFLAITISFVLAPPTAAYVLEGPHVLDLMVKKLGKVATLAAQAKVEIENWPQPGSTTAFYENVTIGVPGMTRIAVSGDNREFVRVRSKGETLTVVDGQIIPSVESIFDLYLDLLSYRSREMLQNNLLNIGIDVSISSLGRYEDKVVFVLGAKYPDLSVSQIWIDKESFLPVRWIDVKVQPNGSYKTMDAVYRKWQRIEKTWFPMAVDFYREQVLIRTVHLSSVSINPIIDVAEMDTWQMKAKYPEVMEHNLFVDQPHPFEENLPMVDSEASVFDDTF